MATIPHALPDYLKGLNTLRFFAAFFVILGHGYEALTRAGILAARPITALNRGPEGVELFFTLSGFLITYLLIAEIKKTGTVDVEFFYVRRILRIWPLYFLCLAMGVFVLTYVVPRVTHADYLQVPLPKFIAFYIFFLPNYPAAFYSVGLLFPLWSIGIEEQFYLFWAPLVRWFRKGLLPLIVAALVVSATWYLFFNFRLADQFDPQQLHFLRTMKFHAMATGALFAYVAHYHLAWYARSFWSSPVAQIAALVVVLYHYLAGFPAPFYVLSVAMSFVYGCIFLNIAMLSRPVTDLEWRPLSYLGQISYGIYMYHPAVAYLLRYSLFRFADQLPAGILTMLYIVLLVGITIGVASLSYHTFERFFLGLRRFYPARSAQQSPVNELERSLGK